MRFLTVERLEAVAIAALLGGYGKVETFRDGAPRRRATLELAGNCEQPYLAELHARDSAWNGRKRPPLTIGVNARCRKCTPCRRNRADMWTARAMEEWSRSCRTLFGTITLAPENHFRMDAACQVRLAKAGTDFWSDLSEQQRFDERVKEIGVEITKWLKRLREGSAAHGKPQFRYLLIAEAHDSAKTSVEMRGRPHFHVLFHETDERAPLVHPSEWARNAQGDLIADKYGNTFVDDAAFLKRQWALGFTRYQQAATPMAAAYLCKYLTKANQARVRASGSYGHTDGPTPDSKEELSLVAGEGENLTPPKGEENVVNMKGLTE